MERKFSFFVLQKKDERKIELHTNKHQKCSWENRWNAEKQKASNEIFLWILFTLVSFDSSNYNCWRYLQWFSIYLFMYWQRVSLMTHYYFTFAIYFDVLRLEMYFWVSYLLLLLLFFSFLNKYGEEENKWRFWWFYWTTYYG